MPVRNARDANPDIGDHGPGPVVPARTGLVLAATLLCAGLSFSGTARGRSATIQTRRAEPRPGKPSTELFAIVKPVYDVTLRAAATGRLEDVRVKPGDHVKQGQQLGRLHGTSYAAALASARAAARMARRSLALDADRLKRAKARYPLLTDRSDLDRSQLLVARARDAVVRARSRLQALRKHGLLTAPVNGTVTRVLAGDGTRITPGDKLIEIQPHGNFWLRGTVYAKAMGRIHRGMRGVFVPTTGGAPIHITVARIFPRNDGTGLGIGMEPSATGAHWSSGESGMVTLYSARKDEPAVPDRALVLSNGRWWVLKDVHGHIARVHVTPDGSRGGWTWLRSGVTAGTPVVVSNAYLLFHKSFASKYSGD